MIDLMTVLALNFAISPFGSLTYAWLMREMRFDTLAIMRFGGSLTGSCVSVFLAWKQFGPLSLAWGSLAATIVNAMLGIRYRPKHFPWAPGLKEIRRVVSFGGRVSLASIVNSVGAGAPDLLLGKLQGFATAGLYSRAFGLASMFHKLVMDAVLSVAMPLFSQAKRDNSDVEGTFLTVISYVTVVGWPFMALLAIFARPLIRLLYGPQWDESVEVTRFLAMGMALILPGVICITTITAFGAAKRLVRTTITTVAIEVSIIALGASHGLSQTGIAFVCAMCIVSALWIESTHHVLAFKWSRLLRVFGSSALVTMITCVIPVLAAIGLPPSQIPALLTLFIGILGGGLSLIAALFFIKHPAKNELTSFLNSIRTRIRDI
jgi:O-antigen/teichoic acid export membrane protein